MAPITTFLFEDLTVESISDHFGDDVTDPPVYQKIVLSKGIPGQAGYARFEFFGAMAGEDWHDLVTKPGTWDLDLKAPA